MRSHARNSFHKRPITAAVLAGLLLALSAAGAQASGQQNTGAQDTSSQNPVDLEVMEVTGSRIKGADMATQVPVVTITAEDLENTGLTSVGDILQQLSSSGSALNTKFNSAGNFGFPPDGGGVGSGSATLDLRNLGAKRVLILVDGLRWVNESSASGVSGAVDLNTIPASIIERIDVLQAGASSLYGSDAVAGVVNIITKRSQDGAAINAYYGDYTGLDGGATHTINASFGNRGDNYQFFIDFSHLKQDAISAAAWGQSSNECVPGTGMDNCSSGTPTGRFIFIDPNRGEMDITPNGSFPNGPAYPDDYHAFGGNDRYNFAPSNLLLTPSERKSVFAQARYDFGHGMSWYAKGLYNNRTSLNQAAPEPIFLGPGAGVGGLGDATGVDVSNPYNPFGFTLDADPDNGNMILIARRPVEGGPRQYRQDVDTFYFATGVEGAFSAGERDFFWDVNFLDSSNRATQTVHGTYNIAHINRALGPIDGCTDGCVPLDIFGGPGTITPEMLDYIQYIEHDRSENKIRAFTANISGSLFNLPAGEVSFAAGGEHRRYSGSYEPDAVVVAGESNGVPSLPTAGSYNINEAYLELNVPLLADVTAARALDLSLATRYSDYSTFGGTTNSRAGIRWQVVDDLTLRGTWAQGFRAPSVGELFGSPARFDATLQDPCSAPIGNPATAANCAAFGVPANYQQSNPQISVRTGGNEDLNPETSTTLTMGAVYSPSWATNGNWADRFDITLGYYRITVDKAIQAPDAQTQLNRCVGSGDPDSVFCQGINRNATGNIDVFSNTLENLGSLKTTGFDFGLAWRGPSTAVGQFDASWQNTYVSLFRANDANGNLEPRSVGIELNDSAIPRLASNLGVGWNMRNWRVHYSVRYLSPIKEDCAAAEGYPVCGSPDEIAPNRPGGTHHLGAVAYNDVRVSWRPQLESVNLTLTGGINNLFDKAPPVCVSCSLNGYDASSYDLPSRFAYLQANLKF